MTTIEFTDLHEYDANNPPRPASSYARWYPVVGNKCPDEHNSIVVMDRYGVEFRSDTSDVHQSHWMWEDIVLWRYSDAAATSNYLAKIEKEQLQEAKQALNMLKQKANIVDWPVAFTTVAKQYDITGF